MRKEILQNWNIDEYPNQLNHTTWDVGDIYILKEYDNREFLIRNIQMLKILHTKGIPVPEVCHLPNGGDFYANENKWYLLTKKLRGKNLTSIDHANAMWLFEFGQTIARLHLSFKECEKEMNFWKNSLLDEMQGWVTDHLKLYAPEYITANEVEKSVRQLAKVYEELPKQLIHRDLHLGNFLFEDMEFSGYIDFDLSQCNIRIFDLCYFLLGIGMLEDDKQAMKEHWLEIVGEVVKGYDLLANLKDIEKCAIPCVMKNIEILFTAYYLGVGNVILAKNAAALFSHLVKNEDKILATVLK